LLLLFPSEPGLTRSPIDLLASLIQNTTD